MGLPSASLHAGVAEKPPAPRCAMPVALGSLGAGPPAGSPSPRRAAAPPSEAAATAGLTGHPPKLPEPFLADSRQALSKLPASWPAEAKGWREGLRQRPQDPAMLCRAGRDCSFPAPAAWGGEWGDGLSKGPHGPSLSLTQSQPGLSNPSSKNPPDPPPRLCRSTPSAPPPASLPPPGWHLPRGCSGLAQSV